MTVQRYLQIQQNSSGSNAQQQQQQHGGPHRKLDRSLSEPKSPKGQNQNTNSSRYKTELCRPFEESGVCKYGDKCQFAHGFHELRTLTRHPKYKTELCCTFHTTGLCPYGSRCHFIHNPDENRAKIMPTLAMPQNNKNSAAPLHGMCHSSTQNNNSHHQQSLRSLSIGSSVSSSSSGELSPSSSPGMFDDPFSPGFYGAAAAAAATSASSSSRAAAALSNAISAFGADFEMSTLAAAFSAAEGNHGGLLKSSAVVTSAPGTPSFGSQLNLLSSSSSSSSCGPWGSPSSSSQDLFQFPPGEMHCPLNPGQQLFEAQSSPVDNISFDFESLTLGARTSNNNNSNNNNNHSSNNNNNNNRANASPNLTRLPIFNQLAHSD